MTTQSKNVCSYAAVTGNNAKSVDVLITDAIHSAKTMKDKVQVAGIAILMHAEKCGDYRKANDLIEGLGQGINGKAIVEWFSIYGGFTISEDGKAFDGWKGADHIKNQFQAAKTTAWYTLAPSNPWGGFNLLEELGKVVKKEEKARAKIKAANDAGEVEQAQELEGKVETPEHVLTAIKLILRDNNVVAA